MNISRWIKGLLLLALISLPLWLGIRKPSHAPDSAFTTITGKLFTLASLRGKPVLITFWATSCQKCIQEMPDLIALYQQFHPQGLEIIAIAMEYDPPNQVVAMTREKQLPYEVVLDIASAHTKAFSPIWGTPTSLLIGPDGMIAKRVVGAFKLIDMQTRIEQLLKGDSKNSKNAFSKGEMVGMTELKSIMPLTLTLSQWERGFKDSVKG